MYKFQLFSSLLLVLGMFYHISSGTSCNYVEDISGNFFPTDFCIGSYGVYANSSTMYKCSSNGTYVTMMAYSDTFNCKGTPSTEINITSISIDYSGFSCGGMSCALVLFTKTYVNNNCSGNIHTFGVETAVTNKCYSSSRQYMYTCTSSEFVLTYYNDNSCTKKNSTITYSGCYKDTSTSIYYIVKTCDNPTSSSQVPAFSAIVSFVVVAIAYFGW